MHLESPHNLKERIRLEDIIVVKKSDPLSASEIESTIRRSRYTSVFSQVRQHDSPVAPREVRQDAEQVRIR
jgi:hypothetical protein